MRLVCRCDERGAGHEGEGEGEGGAGRGERGETIKERASAGSSLQSLSPHKRGRKESDRRSERALWHASATEARTRRGEEREGGKGGGRGGGEGQRMMKGRKDRACVRASERGHAAGERAGGIEKEDSSGGSKGRKEGRKGGREGGGRRMGAGRQSSLATPDAPLSLLPRALARRWFYAAPWRARDVPCSQRNKTTDKDKEIEERQKRLPAPRSQTARAAERPKAGRQAGSANRPGPLRDGTRTRNRTWSERSRSRRKRRRRKKKKPSSVGGRSGRKFIIDHAASHGYCYMCLPYPRH
ncbi:hypothetical protein Mp_1g01660 [Marchantia polymorpha subsp. ruderalis]|uniref:Uncharacterized protein n=2 Tax=Marchantia polymorpha TaxID=3197 RepID=A0AAF6AKG1_MARPO|nr:hypothetical protein MARPO_0029s0080 [Marchantia polymorpha]BBM96931.1 hypothetical protein Mp_1g01660 [Marchantia polymorpha subsp. ruderalis]|eukprot:PTQ42551.1 hypothetical protein MARPO_0029s0080 [Marchantia polymorpha]